MDKQDEIISLLKEQNKRLDAIQKLLLNLTPTTSKKGLYGTVFKFTKWGNWE